MPSAVESTINSIISRFIWGPASNRPIRWVKWNTLYKPKEVGGLGVVDLKLKNRALLNKWLWRFSSEKESLWRKVIVAKYKLEDHQLIPNKLPNKNASWVWKNISAPLQKPNDSFTSNLRWVLGDGALICFWTDYWTEFPSLKASFPRIFRLATKSSGYVCEFGFKSDNRWNWGIDLRRKLFDWERTTWESFLDTINRASINSMDKDKLKWCGSSCGLYKTKDFYLLENAKDVADDRFWKLIWVNYAPPKVEMFVWRAVQDKIPTFHGLLRRGMQNVGNGLCVLCSSELETSNHLFCNCKFTWQLWQKWCNQWGLCFVMPGTMREFLKAGNETHTSRDSKPIWIMAFFGFMWSIWLSRNDYVFKNKKLDPNSLYDSAISRIAFWCKCKWPETLPSTVDFISFPNLLKIAKKSLPRPHICSWIAPPAGTLKFNVDAVVEGSYGVCGLGGILKDHLGWHMLKFSNFGGLSDPTGAEIMAILEAGRLFAESDWSKISPLIIESDSQLATNWINERSECPEVFAEAVSKCKLLCQNRKWCVDFCYRESNEDAHKLAKEGKN